MNSLLEPNFCTGLILAGGAGQRMGGQDKGLLPWRSGTLAGHAATRLSNYGMPVLVSANRNAEVYRDSGLAVVPDRRAGYQGPLAALEAALHTIDTPWLLAVPCDSPHFPDDLMSRLAGAVAGRQPSALPPATAAYVRCGPSHHPVFCLVSATLAEPLTRFLDDGGRRVMAWWQAVGALAVDFGNAAESGFANANTPDDFRHLVDTDRAPADPTCSSSAT